MDSLPSATRDASRQRVWINGEEILSQTGAETSTWPSFSSVCSPCLSSPWARSRLISGSRGVLCVLLLLGSGVGSLLFLWETLVKLIGFSWHFIEGHIYLEELDLASNHCYFPLVYLKELLASLSCLLIYIWQVSLTPDFFFSFDRWLS